MHWKTELIYGEVRYLFFIPVLDFVKPQPGEIFWDLGCGAARPQAIAALNFPFLKACKGVEFLSKLADSAKLMGSVLEDKCKQAGISHAPIQIVQGDMLQVDWYEADIIFFSSVCFPDFLIDGTLDLFEKLKSGTRIISLKTLPTRLYLEKYASLKVRMTWGLHIVVYYRRL